MLILFCKLTQLTLSSVLINRQVFVNILSPFFFCEKVDGNWNYSKTMIDGRDLLDYIDNFNNRCDICLDFHQFFHFTEPNASLVITTES